MKMEVFGRSVALQVISDFEIISGIWYSIALKLTWRQLQRVSQLSIVSHGDTTDAHLTSHDWRAVERGPAPFIQLACDKRMNCFPVCLDVLTVTVSRPEKIVWIYMHFSLNKIKWRNYCCWYSHFLFEKMSDSTGFRKKDPTNHLC
jgi:hypothetical protein